MKTLLILAAIAAATTGPALAGEAPESMQVTVNFSDLDLSHTTGADALIARIKKASSKACGGAPYRAVPESFRQFRVCMVQSMDAAVKQVGVPLVTARYARDPAQPKFAAK